MADAFAVPPALRPILEVGAALLQRSSSGRVLLGGVAGIVDPETLPPALRVAEATLARARAETSVPLPARAVEKLLKDAWGRKPAKVLDGLDLKTPVAVSPVAQVHRGEHDGKPVAVRVRRPGLDVAVRADLALLDALRPPLAFAFPRLDGTAIVRQIREQALDELDFEHTAAQQRAVRRALRGTAGVKVPNTVLDLAAPEVHVSRWLEGPTLADTAPADPSATARALIAAHAGAARAGLVLYDARPNHVILLDDGRIGLLGTGAAMAGDRHRLTAQLALLVALRDPDPDRFATLALRDVGLFVLEPDARAAHRLLRDVLHLDPSSRPTSLDAAFRLAGRATLRPEDVWLARATAQLAAILARLEVGEEWLSLLPES